MPKNMRPILLNGNFFGLPRVLCPSAPAPPPPPFVYTPSDAHASYQISWLPHGCAWVSVSAASYPGSFRIFCSSTGGVLMTDFVRLSVRPSVRRCVVSFSFRWSHFYSFIVTVRVRQRVCVYILTSTREPCRRSSMVLIPLPSPLPFPFPFPYPLPTSISPATAGHSVSQLTWLNNRRMSLRFPRRSCSSIFVFLLNI